MKTLFITIVILLCTLTLLKGQQVVLIRHAEVHLEHSGWISSKKAATYREAYDTAHIHQFDPDTVLAKLPQRITDTVFVSALPRSIATGLKLYGDSAQLISLQELNEFEMHVAWLPLVMPYKGWTSYSRALWLMGAKKKETESYSEAKIRVKAVVDFIEKRAKKEEQVILVTHGFINRTIANELKRRNWVITQNEGKKNLGATILKK